MAVCPIFRPLSYSQHAGSMSGVCTRAIYNSPSSTNGIKHPGNRKGQSADYCWHTPFSSQSLGYIHLETGNIYTSGAPHPYTNPQHSARVLLYKSTTQYQGVAIQVHNTVPGCCYTSPQHSARVLLYKSTTQCQGVAIQVHNTVPGCCYTSPQHSARVLLYKSTTQCQGVAIQVHNTVPGCCYTSPQHSARVLLYKSTTQCQGVAIQVHNTVPGCCYVIAKVFWTVFSALLCGCLLV